MEIKLKYLTFSLCAIDSKFHFIVEITLTHHHLDKIEIISQDMKIPI